jgi:outer membrane protein W
MGTRQLIFCIVFIGVFYISLSNPLYAQEWYTAVSYQISEPRTDTEGFIDNPSYLGWGLDFRKMVRDNVSLGGTFSWNIFHERTSEPIHVNNGGTVTGLQDRTLNAFPIMVNASYYFGQRGGIRPYLGLNLGGFVFLETFSIGIWQTEDTRWDWGMAPEAGVVMPLHRDYALIVSTKYNYAFTGQSVVGQDINNAYVSLSIGLAFQQ